VRLEQLDGAAEREVALELLPARVEHLEALAEILRRRHEPRLADARLALDEHDAAGPAAGAFERRAQRGELVVTLVQVVHRRTSVHKPWTGGPVRRPRHGPRLAAGMAKGRRDSR